MSIRTKQVESTLLRAISKVIENELNDPRVAGMVTITEVKVSPDLRDAKVLVSVMPPDKAARAMHALKRAAKHIRRRVADQVALSRMPILNFQIDESLKKLAAVFEDIKKGMARTGESPSEVDPATEGDPAAESNAESAGNQINQTQNDQEPGSTDQDATRPAMGDVTPERPEDDDR